MNLSTVVNRLIPTLYEDEHLLAVAKPAGIDTGGLARQTVPGLLEVVTELRGDGVSLTAANRLSRYESGVVLFAKSAVMARHIRTGLRSMRIQQEYVIAVLGRSGRSRVVIEGDPRPPVDRSAKHPPRRRPTKQRTSSNATDTGRDRATTITPIRASAKHSLIRCRTYSPTTHALRAQLRSVGLRAVGDSLGSTGRARTSHPMTHFHLERLTFFHPGAKRKIAVRAPIDKEYGSCVLDGRRNIIRSLHAALIKRLPCMSEPDTNCFRLITGPAEDVPGLVAEKCGDIVVLEVADRNAQAAPELKAIGRWYRDVLGVHAVYVKDIAAAGERARRGASTAESAESPSATMRLLVGKPVDDEVVVVERGLRFAVRLSAGRSVGLFLDQRENRARIRSMAEGKDVLNLFAYTCGFSVAAAAGGARSTVSVDLSPAALEWGKENFAHNDFESADHSFVRSDAKTFLKLAAKRGRMFDLVILDPPSFAHGRKRGTDFSIQRDLSDIIAASAAVLSRGGTMMVSTNLRRISATALRAKIKAGTGKRRHLVLEEPRLPPDFAADTDHAKTVFVRFD